MSATRQHAVSGQRQHIMLTAVIGRSLCTSQTALHWGTMHSFVDTACLAGLSRAIKTSGLGSNSKMDLRFRLYTAAHLNHSNNHLTQLHCRKAETLKAELEERCGGCWVADTYPSSLNVKTAPLPQPGSSALQTTTGLSSSCFPSKLPHTATAWTKKPATHTSWIETCHFYGFVLWQIWMCDLPRHAAWCILLHSQLWPLLPPIMCQNVVGEVSNLSGLQSKCQQAAN